METIPGMSKNPVAAAVSTERLFAGLIGVVEKQCRELSAPEKNRIHSDIELRIPSVVSDNQNLAIDDASQRYLQVCAFVLAAFDALSIVVSDNATKMALMKAALASLFAPRIRDYIKDRFDVDAAKPEQAFAKVSENFRARGERFLGRAFIYEEEREGEGEVTFLVSRCFFLNFFRHNGRPEITPIFCALDTIWGQEFNEGPYNLQFDRPTVMSLGDDKCRFHFLKAE